jgi:hypothetical protein
VLYSELQQRLLDRFIEHYSMRVCRADLEGLLRRRACNYADYGR